MAVAMAILTGCTSATPSKAQQATIKADVITIHGGGKSYCDLLQSYTNLPPAEFARVIEAVTGLASATEQNLISQTMANETGGDETSTQTARGPDTPIDVSVPTGTDAISALAGQTAYGITKGIRDTPNSESGDGGSDGGSDAGNDGGGGNAEEVDEKKTEAE